MLISLNMMINYGQIILYFPSVERPGHQWGDAEQLQGFAWSPGIVSLAVPEHAFMCIVNIDIVSDYQLDPGAISAIRVPFEINETPVFVGSIFHYDEVDLAPDKYSMFAELLPGVGTWEIDSDGVKEQGEFDYIVNLKFVSDKSNSFEILQTGGAVNSDRVLSRLTELA
jgi:hypothetical protein